MTFQSKFRLLALAVVATLSSQAAFADPLSSCANTAGSPQTVNGVLLTTFTCDIYHNAPTETISLVPYLTQGGATLANNNVSAGYEVIIDGDPLAISANNTNVSALYNPALWEAVLFFPGDLDSGFASDTLTVYWPGAFPSATTVRSVDEGLYSQFGVPDTLFFRQAAFPVTNVEGSFNVHLTSTSTVPEPNSWVLAISGVLGLGLFAGARRFTQYGAGSCMQARS
jgi:hypothetical protein